MVSISKKFSNVSKRFGRCVGAGVGRGIGDEVSEEVEL